jgi:hypothetical protein
MRYQPKFVERIDGQANVRHATLLRRSQIDPKVTVAVRDVYDRQAKDGQEDVA